jgi:microcystin-dependent protein
VTRPRSTTSQADELGAILSSLKSRIQSVELLAHTPCTGGGGSTTPAGLVSPYAGVAAPSGWLLCDGTAYDQTLYPALFAVIGSTYNNASGQPSPSAGFFRVPDLRSRMPIGAGTGLGLTNRPLTSSSGQETRQIASANLPLHQHSIDHDHPAAGGAATNTNINHGHGIGFSFFGHAAGGVITARPDGGNPLTYASVAADPVHSHTVDLPNFAGTSGNGGFANTALDIMNPFLALNFIIKA